MLELGAQLYNLTPRDLQTSFLDPFFRSGTVTLAAAQANNNVELTLPVDRSLYVHSLIFDLAAEAATNWESFSVNARRSGELVALVYQEAITPVLNTRYSKTIPIDLVLPPGADRIRFGATRLTTTNAVTATFQVLGYLIPPGEIARA